MQHATIQRSFIDNLHIRIFEARWLRLQPNRWTARNVRDPFWRLYCNAEDGAFLQLADQTFELLGNHLYFVPAGVHFSCGNRTHVEHFYIHFDVIGLPGQLLARMFHQPVAVPSSPQLLSRVRTIAADLVHSTSVGLAQQCQLKAVLWDAPAAYLAEVPSERSDWLQHVTAAHEPVLPALQYIEEKLHDVLPNAQLARLCHLSEDHFIRRFRECVGQSPLQYILERRIALAAQHLLFSDASIEQIAEQCGFGNRFYFSRVFTRRIGMAPAAYRKISRV